MHWLVLYNDFPHVVLIFFFNVPFYIYVDRKKEKKQQRPPNSPVFNDLNLEPVL